jgi:iron complex outermembrane receptor protein
MNFVSTPVRAAVLGLLASVSLVPALGHAQNATMKETVVTASRFEEYRVDAPMAVQVLTREDLTNSGVQSVPDALRMLAGVNIRSNAPGQLDLNSAVDLGGFGVTATQNTLVLVDGRRLNPIDSSEIAWSAVALSAIERIEIASGGAGVQYGAGATGGVINIITRQSGKDNSQVQAGAGSFGTAQTSLVIDRQFDDVSVGVNASALKSDGWRENSQVQAQNLMARAKKVLDAHSYVFAEVGVAQQSTGFAGGVVAKVGEGNQQAAKFNNVGSNNTVQQNNLRLGGFKALSALSSLDVDVSFGKKSSDFKQPYYDTSDSFGSYSGVGYLTGSGRSKLDADTLSFSPKLKTSFKQGGSLVAGYDFSQAKQNGAALFSAAAQQVILNNQVPFGFTGNVLTDTQSVQLLNHSLYALARMPLSNSLEGTVGLRRQLQNFDTADVNKKSGSQTSQGQYGANAYELGLNFKSGPASRYFLRLNHSFRFANTDEYWGSDPVTFNRVFSGELKPQYTRAYEVGYEHVSGAHQAGLAVGQSVTQNEIRYNPSFYRNSNLSDDVFRTSLAANYAYSHGAGGRLMLGARLQRAEFLNGAFAGQALGLVPHATFNATWLQAIDVRTKLGLSVLHVAKQNYDVAPESATGKDQMPAYTTADLFWTRNYGKLDTKITVKNLTGSVYSNYGGYGFVQGPAAGGASNYYYFPSDPRSVHLSATYNF